MLGADDEVRNLLVLIIISHFIELLYFYGLRRTREKLAAARKIARCFFILFCKALSQLATGLSRFAVLPAVESRADLLDGRSGWSANACDPSLD